MVEMANKLTLYHLTHQFLKKILTTYFSYTLKNSCLLYTSDAADERSSVDLGGRRIIKKKKLVKLRGRLVLQK